MPFSIRSFRIALTLFCFAVGCAPRSCAQEWTKDPTTWWPDPSAGLMWTGQIHSGSSTYPKLAIASRSMYWMGLNWQQADEYCGALRLDGSGWRLPTLDEVKEAVEIIKVTPTPVCPSADVAIHGDCRDQDLVPGSKYTGLALRGRIDLFDQSMTIWTATQSQTASQSAWAVDLDPIPRSFISLSEMTSSSFTTTDSKATWASKLDSVQPTALYTTSTTEVYMGVVCVRRMEPDLLAISKQAAVEHPVPDVQTLQTFIPLNRARLAYQAGSYQESITQAQTALSLRADPATANWGIGISYGRLGQWDQAITSLQSALAIDKNFADAQTALKWAKDGLKAAKKGKLPKEPNPTWN